MTKGIIDFLKTVHIYGYQRGDFIGIDCAVVIKGLEIQSTGKRVFFAQLVNGKNIIDEKSNDDCRAENCRVIPSKQERQKYAGSKGKGEINDRHDFCIEFVAVLIKAVNQTDTVHPCNDIRKISKRSALKRPILRKTEYDACKDRNKIDHSKHQSRNKNVPSHFLLQCVENHRDN